MESSQSRFLTTFTNPYYFPYDLVVKWGERLKNSDPSEASFAPDSTAMKPPPPNHTHEIIHHQGDGGNTSAFLIIYLVRRQHLPLPDRISKSIDHHHRTREVHPTTNNLNRKILAVEKVESLHIHHVFSPIIRD